jgi:hypothetical protein
MKRRLSQQPCRPSEPVDGLAVSREECALADDSIPTGSHVIKPRPFGTELWAIENNES